MSDYFYYFASKLSIINMVHLILDESAQLKYQTKSYYIFQVQDYRGIEVTDKPDLMHQRLYLA